MVKPDEMRARNDEGKSPATPAEMKALAAALRSNADAHMEPEGTERRRAANMLESSASQIEALKTRISDLHWQINPESGW